MDTGIVSLDDLESVAVKVLPKNALDYFRSGAEDMVTLKDNREAFKRYRLNPPMMTDVSTRSLETTVLGEKVSMPVGIAPTAMQRMAHPQGECATAAAAQKAGALFILSTISTSSIEEVAAAAPDALKWFQLYIYKDRKVTEKLVKRAEKAGFKAIVLTVDAPYFGRRLPDIRNKFELPGHLTMANFSSSAGEEASTATEAKSKGGSGINEYVSSLFDQSLTWADVDWLKSITNLPLVLKGILRADDALTAISHGADAIIVSNHGARQLDGVLATIDALPSIVEAVSASGKKCEVYMDGGIRKGTDVLKALAMGARMVFTGRPAVWGLATAGQKGVEKMLQIMRDELDNCMALSGCTSVDDIVRRNLIIRPNPQNIYSNL